MQEDSEAYLKYMSPPRTTKVYKVRFGGRSAYVASEYSWRRSRHIGDGYVILFLLRVQSSHDTAAEAQETRGDCAGLYARVDTRHKGNGRGVVICLLLYFNGMLLLYCDDLFPSLTSMQRILEQRFPLLPFSYSLFTRFHAVH